MNINYVGLYIMINILYRGHSIESVTISNDLYDIEWNYIYLYRIYMHNIYIYIYIYILYKYI